MADSMLKGLNYRAAMVFAVLAFFIFASCNDDDTTTNHPDSKFNESPVTATVTWVYDGDTFLCKIYLQEEKIRVLDIDAFETQEGTRLNEQARKAGISADSALKLGYAAKDFAIDLLSGKEIILTRDKYGTNKDIYGRYLRYVEVGGKPYDSLIAAAGLLVP